MNCQWPKCAEPANLIYGFCEGHIRQMIDRGVGVEKVRTDPQRTDRRHVEAIPEVAVEESAGSLLSTVSENGAITLKHVLYDANALGLARKQVQHAEWADKEQTKIRLIWACAPNEAMELLQRRVHALQLDLQAHQQTIEAMAAALKHYDTQMAERQTQINNLNRQLANGRLDLYEIPDLGAEA